MQTLLLADPGGGEPHVLGACFVLATVVLGESLKGLESSSGVHLLLFSDEEMRLIACLKKDHRFSSWCCWVNRPNS